MMIQVYDEKMSLASLLTKILVKDLDKLKNAPQTSIRTNNLSC